MSISFIIDATSSLSDPSNFADSSLFGLHHPLTRFILSQIPPCHPVQQPEKSRRLMLSCCQHVVHPLGSVGRGPHFAQKFLTASDLL